MEPCAQAGSGSAMQRRDACKRTHIISTVLRMGLVFAAVGGASASVAECSSFLNCTQLGNIYSGSWPSGSFNDMYGAEQVCGESDIDIDIGRATKSQCHNNVDFPTSLALCAAVGARLCTVDEMKHDETRGTGCGFDGQAIWTSTRGTCGAGSFVSIAGNSMNADDFPPKCTSIGTKLYARCCAELDTPPGQWASCATNKPASLVGCAELNWLGEDCAHAPVRPLYIRTIYLPG